MAVAAGAMTLFLALIPMSQTNVIRETFLSLLCRMCKVKKPFDMLCELFLNWGGLVLFWMWGITRTGVKWGLLNVLVGKRRSD